MRQLRVSHTSSNEKSCALPAPAVGTAVEILRFAQDDTMKRIRRSETSAEDPGFPSTRLRAGFRFALEWHKEQTRDRDFVREVPLARGDGDNEWLTLI
jgi:hypothetical protein